MEHEKNPIYFKDNLFKKEIKIHLQGIFNYKQIDMFIIHGSFIVVFMKSAFTLKIITRLHTEFSHSSSF